MSHVNRTARAGAVIGVLALVPLSWASSVFAASGPAVAAIPATVFASLERLPAVAESAREPAYTRPNPFGSKPMAAAALATKRGGDRVFNDAQLKGVVSDNQVSNVNTGMNVISDGAFAGSAGLSTVIQNSGNNVLIQNSTIVNVQLK